MPSPRSREVTRLLDRLRAGDGAAGEELFTRVYDELRGLAQALHGARSRTMQPTALVHEAWLKLAGNLGQYESRKHFFVVASRAMRQVLADYARLQQRDKRGGGAQAVTLSDELGQLDTSGEKALDLVALDDSLRRLAELNERHARVVELRFLGALTIEETAEVLGVSHGTVESDWSMARAWLRRELAGG